MGAMWKSEVMGPMRDSEHSRRDKGNAPRPTVAVLDFVFAVSEEKTVQIASSYDERIY